MSVSSDNFWELAESCQRENTLGCRYDIVSFMATTRSKSTPKSKKPAKTTKKVINKSKKAAPAAKTTTAKVNTKTTVSTAVKGPLSPFERIRSMHISSALVYIIFSGLVLAFVSTAAVAVTLGLQTRDEFASDGNTILGPASEVLYNLEPKFVLMGALLTSALASILLATKLRARYQATLANRTSGLRWLTLGLSAGLTLTFINMLAGIHDMALLKLSAVMIIVTTMLSFIAERDNVAAVRPKWLAYNLSLLAGAVAWLPLAGSMVGTTLYGMERFGWHVYALAAVTLIGFTAVAVHLYSNLRAGTARDYFKTEEKYLRIDLLTKFAVVVIVVLALK